MSTETTVLVVEDERDILEVIEYHLKREGFKVSSLRNGGEAVARVRRERPDLVILDLMLPGLDGIEVCRQLKENPLTRGVPVIMVTAKGEESDVILGLGVGADDYIPKPFSPKELLARVRAVLRRGPLRAERRAGSRIQRKELVIDMDAHRVEVEGRAVPFTATEIRLIHALASHPGKVFSRDELLTRAIGKSAFIVDRNIDVHIRSIRKKIRPYRDLVETVRGVGYRFREEET